MEKDIKKSRAWIEINLDNLKNNIEQIKSIIPDSTKIMAVVKANAYGHGIIEVAKYLNKLGINDFAVATLAEGINLRENNITGNILILGYTDLKAIKYVVRYNLIQTILDYEYAQEIENLKLKEKLKVHIKINTGMNRIGESYKSIDNLSKIYQLKNIEVLGTYTHLCSSDSLKEDDVLFTRKQIENFYNCINSLKSLGCNIGKIHIQSSYGVLNYPDLKCDYVRTGIIMYGIYSNYKEYTKIKIDIKPILSLKATITTVKEIDIGETIGYGRTFIADKNMKIATVGIGYADGYPRDLSNKNTKVLINGKYATIIGRICMDQLVVDVSDIENIKRGDTVTLIGKEQEISAEKIANKSETITNELLSRLGNRLEIITY